MNKQEAKQWAELYTAIAEGKAIQIELESGEWKDISIERRDCLEGYLFEYRIKPTPKIRRRTYQELADWLRDCPEEHREWKWKGESMVQVSPMYYDEDNAHVECDEDILVRRNHGEWEEPIIEVEEF